VATTGISPAALLISANRSVLRSLIAVLCATSVATFALDARSQQPSVAGRPTEVAGLLALDLSGTWVRQLPTMAVGPENGSGKIDELGTIPSPGSAQLMGLNLSVGMTLNNRWMLPIVGGGYSWAVGPHPLVWTSVNGSITQLRPWTFKVATILLPGFGVRYTRRRWMFETSVRSVVHLWSMDGAIAEGPNAVDVRADKTTFGFVGELATCRRLDPISRVCWVVSPVVYEAGWASAVSVGIRWEAGQ
jgi:hypothetical protein